MLNAVPLITLLAAAPTAEAADRGLTIGVFGGSLITPDLEVLGDTPVIIPRIGYWFNPTVGVEVDVGLMPFGRTQERVPDSFPYFATLPSVNLVGRVFESEAINLVLSVGAGAFYKDVNDGGLLELPPGAQPDLDFAGISGPGIMVPIGPIALRADYKWILSIGSDAYENRGASFIHGQWSAGVQYLPVGRRDKDRDGVNDDDDLCPEQAEDLDGHKDEDGCLDPDNDGDGILDVNEGTDCVDQPEDLDEFEDTDGCPDPDNDEDEVLDQNDDCPIDFGPKATGGCPDADTDLLRDLDDECPNEAGPTSAFGCPDGDEDRVPDYRDACPDEAGNEGADARRSDGCFRSAFVTESSIVITDKVYFSSGRDTIQRRSYSLLDTVAQVMTDVKGIKKLKVEGHTDSSGDDQANLELSQRRANAVVEYLVGKGIAEERLVAEGFGETKAVADNESAEGREQNRRVEFTILEQEVGATQKSTQEEPPAETEEGSE